MTLIHWFRRDLRLKDNTALVEAAKRGAVLPVYILPRCKSGHQWTSPARRAFLKDCLESLAKEIAQGGGTLVIREGDAVEELERLAQETGAAGIYFNRDPDPFGRATEERLREMAARNGINVHGFKDIAIHERDEILTASGQSYRVFTPYSRAWRTATPAQIPELKLPSDLIWSKTPLKSLPLPAWEPPNPSFRIQAGEKAAWKRFDRFFAGPLFEYANLRDFPAGNHNSRLSADLRFGTISIRQVYNRCMKAGEGGSIEARKSVATFVNELIWREFYFQILWHWPEVLEEEFNPKFREVKWLQPQGEHRERFERWCNGQTGFPIVDAAMRQLNATGYMHNRLRMIVAMFLTKDLHLDWRQGERYFMQHLVDGDIAANNGGWQWSAGSGADAAPYFRIQNPWTQTARFDPEGEFIHQWIPELAGVAPGKFHAPPAPGIRLAKEYPLPMLDHARERLIALGMV